MTPLSGPSPHEQVDEPVVLVTAFGPFPGQPTNPTELIVDQLAGQEHVVSHVLDVSYRRAVEQLDDLVRMVHPAAVVAFGLAGGATTVRVEAVAWNVDDAPEPDVEGDIRRGQQIDRGPERVAGRFPVAAILDALGAAGVPAVASEDPGRYVCNHVYRHLLTAGSLADRLVGFVHVPPLSAPGFDAARIALAGQVVVDAMAAAARGDL